MKDKKPLKLPVGKSNKNLGELYEEKKQVPFHSVQDTNIKMQRTDYAQLQAWGKKGQ